MRERAMNSRPQTRPYIGLHCVDCTVGTMALDEFYIVHDHVWEQAWADRRKSWLPRDDEILCIGCLEKRIGRTLTRHDFTDAPINLLDQGRSDRLRDRLTVDGPPRQIPG